ncbi:hypothetical protein [Bradyrhizobium sp. SZCCHNS3051]|uniref:hypothetical protein n=1 Tax=Bradyrhizobium sp. SZCCHNS3051 TaxID=3057320 RepID=UPI0029168699|nr:hypothetical protein [Bradyrhizobium sp. SZCCHNS3051]
MYYQEAIREAARRASQAAADAIAAYDDDTISYERGITDSFAVLLRKALNNQIENLVFRSHVLKDTTGSGAEESQIGADLLIHVEFKTPELSYSKGILVQAKRVEPGERMPKTKHEELVDQCKKMLSISPASWIFDYAHGGMRCGPAAAIATSNNMMLHEQCIWTPYRFFLELFRCPIGDPSITSARVEELPVRTKLITKITTPSARESF